MSGVAKPPPWVAEMLQPWVGSLAQLPRHVPIQWVPPNFPACCLLIAQQPLSPSLRCPHLLLGGLPLPPLLPPGAGKPALCPSWPGAATPPVQWAPYPGHLSWWLALARPTQIPPATNKVAGSTGTCLGADSSVRGASPRLHLHLPLLPPLTPHGHPLLLHLLHILAWS